MLRRLGVRERAVRESLRAPHEARGWAREEAKLSVERATEELRRALDAVPPELE